MGRLVQRRTGRGYEREIHNLSKLRTAVMIDNRLETSLTGPILASIDALILSLRELIKMGLDIDRPVSDSTPPPPSGKPEK